ncbi:MAG TPA: hypothetical protein PKZ74_10000 [Bacteroidales bacterium]|nr:hypothetical protein [Bacteroidales bacterium]
MDVDEIAFLEKLVDRECEPAAHAEHRAIEIRPRPQVGDRAEELGRVAFFLQREIFRHSAEQFDRNGLHFPSLTCGGRGDQFPAHLDGCAGAHLRDVFISGNLRVRDDLEISQTGAVVEFDERKRLGIPPRPDPAGDVEIVRGFRAFQDVFDERPHA